MFLLKHIVQHKLAPFTYNMLKSYVFLSYFFNSIFQLCI